MVITDRRWYLASKGDVHGALKEAVEVTLGCERPRLSEAARLLTLFREKRGTFGSMGLNLPLTVSRLARNQLRSLVKTAQSRILAIKPVPFFCSEGGDLDLRTRLEMLNEATAGLFVATRFDDNFAPLMVLHGALLGTGHVKVYAHQGKVAVERVYPWEVFVDQLDGLYGQPRTLYQVRWLDRPVLREMFDTPKAREAIRLAPTDRAEWAGWVQGLGEPVRVIEAWHLADSEGKGGRHVIALDNATLRDEEYTYDEFPVVTYRWSDAEDGFWPDGLGHELYGKQLEINRISDAIAETVRRCAWPRVFVEHRSEVSAAQLDNTIGSIVRYRGVMPQTVAAQGLTAEARQHLADLVQSCNDDTGISAYASSSTKPAGLQSGRALRIYADQQDGRLRDPGEKWTAARVAVGRAMVRAMREIAAENPRAEVLFTDPKGKAIRRIVWADVDVPDERLDMICQPVSSLPQTPAAKAALLDELYNGGAITLEEYRDGLDLPDVKALTDPAKAPRRAIEKSLDVICKEKRYVSPEPVFPLEMARTLGAQRYCQAYVDEADDLVLELLRRWVQDCSDLIASMAAPQGAPQEAPPPEMAPPEMPVEGAAAPAEMPI